MIVPEPAQILTGLTGGLTEISRDSVEMLKDWADGTYAEYILTLPSVLTRLGGVDHVPSERLAYLSKFAIPFGGLLRGDLRPAQTLIVNGATGYPFPFSEDRRIANRSAPDISCVFRHWAGVIPIWLWNARWNAASDW
jgi:hypothetical protein